jgi:Pyruvate/2-oxoacid:ferredoxin oxidoreductase gamma subunit
LRSHPASIFCIPASRIADDLGNAKVTNMVMLGALLELTGILPRETSFDLLREKLGQTALLELDIRAIDAGIAHMRRLLDGTLSAAQQRGRELASPLNSHR